MKRFLTWSVVVTVGFFLFFFLNVFFFKQNKITSFYKKGAWIFTPKHRYEVFRYKKCIDFFCYKKWPVGCQTWKQILTVFSVLAVHKALLLKTEIERYHRVVIQVCCQLAVALDHMWSCSTQMTYIILLNYLTNPSIWKITVALTLLSISCNHS